MIRTFLWDRKKSKISLQRLQQDITKGGLKLVDLEIKDKSLKYSNFCKLQQKQDKSIINAIAKKILDANPYTSNLHINDIKKSFRKSYDYIRDCILAWSCVNF